MRAVISDHLFPSIELQRAVITQAGFELLEAEPACVSEDDTIDRCSDADVLLVQWTPISRRVLGSLPKLRAVVRYGIGVNNIDLDAAKDLGIGVANVPSYCIEEVSNHAIAMILSLGRRIPQDHYRIAHGDWGIATLLPIAAFTDLTLGLIGFGTIARGVADKAEAFGFRIISSDPFVKKKVFDERAIEQMELNDLFQNADIISVHCPLVKETTHLIDNRTIAKMEDRSYHHQYFARTG